MVDRVSDLGPRASLPFSALLRSVQQLSDEESCLIYMNAANNK